MKIQGEFTDTFGGEANYSWVRRCELDVPDNLSDRAIVRRIKAELGLNGARASRRENHGDLIALWNLGGSLTVLFITFGD